MDLMMIFGRIASTRRGQTALEYMLMIAVIFSILALVIAMTAYVDSVGASLGGTIDATRGQVIDWILT
jgi:Tfp pilus assembly protein PilE